ncbi:major facilitator superfamily domain-containing protein 6-like protein B [Sycon ciliatum]|uniref:major facilitator superfamily domain-containing protein 6-like protein B n=1 Tax=Sycon ciliatum TaxID=27933 RepID=UPI0020AB4D8D|eukprot:scpid45001/ scgid8445/ Major facilitator superfamily domain-containing protein 6; Macrophage MHC class I receptor 2
MSDHGIGGFPNGAGCVGCGDRIPKLCVSRMYYFLTFAMLGTFWMLLATFARYLGLTATQAGIISGARPLVAGVAVAVWTHIADRFQRLKKPILLLGVTSHLLLSVAIVFFKPEFSLDCKPDHNRTDSTSGLQAQFLHPYSDTVPSASTHTSTSSSSSTHSMTAGFGSQIVNYTVPSANSTANSTDVVGCRDVLAAQPTSVKYGALRLTLSQTFAVLLSLVLLNECLGAGITSMADVATYAHLGRENYVQFGWIRVFGAAGWALGIFSLTMAAEYFNASSSSSSSLSSYDVDDNPRVHLSGNYQLVFSILAVILCLSFVTGALFEFTEHASSLARTALRKTLQQVLTPRMVLLSVVIVHSGAAIGVGLSFLFWRIQDIGGRQSVMGVASLISAASDVPAFILAPAAIRRLTAEKVLLIGIVCQVVYFGGVGLVTQPWQVLVFQPVMGGMHGLLWASVQAIFVPLSSPGTESLMIGLLHTLMYGLGYALGNFVGGALIDGVGSQWTFLAVCFSSVAIFLLQLASICYFGDVPSPSADGFHRLGKSPVNFHPLAGTDEGDGGEESEEVYESTFSAKSAAYP